MRILQLVQKPQRRGAEIFAYQLSEHFEKLGHQIKTAYLYPAPPSNALPIRPQDSVLANTENRMLEKLVGLDPSMLKALATLVRDFKPDVIQLNGGRSVKYGTLLRLVGGGPKFWVLVYRNIGDPNVWLKRRWLRWIFQIILMPRVDGIVAVSSLTLNALRSFYPSSKNIIHIPNAVNDIPLNEITPIAEIRLKAETPLDGRVLLFAGSLTSEKRVDRLLELAEHAIKSVPGFHLWILGDGPLRAELERKASGSHAASRIRFLGVQDHVVSFMNAADLLVLPSETEGIPGVVLEAALLKLPCVAMNVGALPECIVDGETGILVESGNVAQLTSSVVSLLQNPQRVRELGTSARRWVMNHFSLEIVVQQYLQFYLRLIAGRKSVPLDKKE